MDNLQFTFGKFRNIPIKDVFESNYYYVDWLVKQLWFQMRFNNEYKYCYDLISKRKAFKNSDVINDQDIVIYTDGACKGNGKKNAKAGIGVHFSPKNIYKFNDISEPINVPKPSNNIAELQAILTALRILKEYSNKIIIYTDSEYCINCITKWFPQWVTQKKLNGKQNIDLIRPIYQYYLAKELEFRHVKSHTGLQDEHSLGNQQADYLANCSLLEK